MWLSLREQVIEQFVECSTPAGCVKTGAKLLAVPRKTKRNGWYMREIGTNIRRIVRFPLQVKPAEPKRAS